MAKVPAILRGTTYEPFTGRDGQLIQIAKCSVTFNATVTEPATVWNGKPVLDWWGQQVVAELAIAGELKKHRWNAFWVSSDGIRSYLPNCGCRLRRAELVHTKPFVRYPNLRHTLTGAWDVLAWAGEEIRFYEVKWDGKRRGAHVRQADTIQSSQIEFLNEMIARGANPDQFGIVEWTIT